MAAARPQIDAGLPGFSATVVKRSDVGLVRENNEDTVVLVDLATGEPFVCGQIGRAGVLFGICDGMGGEAAGEVASRIAAETVQKVMAHASPDIDEQSFAKALSLAVDRAGKSIKDYVAAHPRCKGMGTTCTVAAVRGELMVLAHVGDSRAYLFRGNQLTQLTRDHNLANELLAIGRITPEQVHGVVHGKRITQAVGSSDQLAIDLVDLQLAVGDRVLICSDGLSDLVSEADIESVLREHGAKLDGAADELVERARAGRGRDNISLVISQFDVAPAGPEFSDEELRLPTLWRSRLLGATALLFAAVACSWLVRVDEHVGRLRVASAAASAAQPTRERVVRNERAGIAGDAPRGANGRTTIAEHAIVNAVDTVRVPGPTQTRRRETSKRIGTVQRDRTGGNVDDGVVRPPEPGRSEPVLAGE